MRRAAVIIGVDRTGDLPVLKDAARGARRVEQWAHQQQIDTVEILTDEDGGVVEARAIKTVVRKIVEAGTYEQLVVYFAGHGVNIATNEYWLLSGAPDDTQEAVNLVGSENLARQCGIPHVVFISDACRTAAEGIRAQRITGSEIFPNDSVAGPENPVDRLVACLLGSPALEVRDPSISASEYTALYTSALLDGLSGKQADILEWDTERTEPAALVRPRPLKKYLSMEVPRRLAALNLKSSPIQIPDGRIVSDSAWLALLRGLAPSTALAAGVHAGPTRGGMPAPSAAQGAAQQPPATTATMSGSLIASALSGNVTTFESALSGVRSAPSAHGADMMRTVDATMSAFGPMHFETECGFKIRGARVVEAFAVDAQLELLGSSGDLVRVNSMVSAGVSVLLRFRSGHGVVLPALPGFIAALTVEDEELVDVAYEPSDNTSLWHDYQPRIAGIRALRAVAAASTRSGVFQLDTENALDVARSMQFAKGVDPTLAVYAAYAYYDLQRLDLLRDMSTMLFDCMGGRWFDVALLATDRSGKWTDSTPVVGFAPLLTQGWALLSAYQTKLPRSLDGLRDTLIPSVWTTFDATGLRMIRAALQAREIR